MHLTTFRVNIWGYFIPTLINRVKYIISNTMRLLYKCHTFLESLGQDLYIQPYSGLMTSATQTIYRKIGLTFFESSEHCLSIKPEFALRLMVGDLLTQHSWWVLRKFCAVRPTSACPRLIFPFFENLFWTFSRGKVHFFPKIFKN